MTTAILAVCRELSEKYFDRLWTSGRAEFEVSIGRRRDRVRKVTSEGFELVGYGTSDDNEWPGYFEPVRERRWFGGEWVLVQPVPDAARRIEDHLRRWVEAVEGTGQ